MTNKQLSRLKKDDQVGIAWTPQIRTVVKVTSATIYLDNGEKYRVKDGKQRNGTNQLITIDKARKNIKDDYKLRNL
jgi:hypothetical protein